MNGAATDLTARHVPALVRGASDFLAQGWNRFGILLVFVAMLSVGLAIFYRTSVRHPPGIQRKVWSGTFVAFVGDSRSKDFVEEARAAFALGTRLQATTHTLPSVMPLVAASDQRSFAHEGFPAALLTDTGPLRNKHQPSKSEMPALLNYDAMADVVFGLASVAARLARGDAPLE